MIALFVQTLLLMAAAYFVGAALACVIRRSLFAKAAQPAAAERRVEPLAQVAQRAGGARFQRAAVEPRARVAVSPPAPAAVVVGPTEAQPAQDLKRISLIDAALEASLNRLGVRRYEQIAAWMQSDVKRVDNALALEGRISRENWIEQAQILAKGAETLYAIRRARGEAANAAPTPDEGERRSIGRPGDDVMASRSSAGAADTAAAHAATSPLAAAVRQAKAPADEGPRVAERAAFGPQPLVSPIARPSVPPPQPAVPIRPTAPAPRDNLLRISGVDPEVERLLVGQGVTRYSQIAHWSPADVDRLETQLGSAGRIARENWIEQAQILSRGGDTRFSRQYDQGGRSEAGASPRPLKLADAIQEQSTKGDARLQGQGAHDDLKRIRGIGVLIENRLNGMGVTDYEQIANWTAADIERVSQSLDFKGRIERENWVEQARILASGGATEFSRRVDRGEMDTGRYKR